jgi:hypothetical protein
LNSVVDYALVEILAAQERIAVCRKHLELMLTLDVGDFDNRDIERAAAEVVDRDLAVAFLLVESKRERSRRRLVDDAFDVEARDLACVLGGLPLRIVEVRRNGNDGLGHFLAKIIFRGLLHLAQNFRRHLLRSDLLAANLDPRVAIVSLDDFVWHQRDVLLHFLFLEAPADQPFDREDGVLRIGNCLSFRGSPNENLAVLEVGDDRRRRARAFRIFDDLGLAAFHDGDTTVGCA